ncbi:hypothetical protein bcgnr5371_16120 [Bacillus cereus]
MNMRSIGLGAWNRLLIQLMNLNFSKKAPHIKILLLYNTTSEFKDLKEGNVFGEVL